MIPGIDISEYQDKIVRSKRQHPDLAQAVASGIRFAFIRHSDGMTGNRGCGPDVSFEHNWEQAGLLVQPQAIEPMFFVRGAYQFFRPTHGGGLQAESLLSGLNGFTDADLPPVLDLENDSVEGLDPEFVVDQSVIWASRMNADLGRTPILYTNISTLALLGEQSVRLYPFFPILWVTQLGVKSPKVPAPWARWAFWQHCWTGRVAGFTGNVDLDWYAHSEAQLAHLITLSKVLS